MRYHLVSHEDVDGRKILKRRRISLFQTDRLLSSHNTLPSQPQEKRSINIRRERQNTPPCLNLSAKYHLGRNSSREADSLGHGRGAVRLAVDYEGDGLALAASVRPQDVDVVTKHDDVTVTFL